MYELTASNKQLISSYIEQFDAQLSRFRSDSLITKLSTQATTAHFSEDLVPLFEWYEQLERYTDGIVTPTIGNVLEAAGYDATYSLTPKKTPLPAQPYHEVIKRTESTVTTVKPTLLDYGAAGKGFLVDKLCSILKEAGHKNFVVDGSGDLRHVSEDTTSEEVIGLQDPNNHMQVIGRVVLKNRALCASAVTGRQWSNWHHIINGRTASPTNTIVATWVIADSAMIADGLATALFFIPAEKLPTQYTYEYLRLYKNGTVECSDYFSKGVFTQ